MVDQYAWVDDFFAPLKEGRPPRKHTKEFFAPNLEVKHSVDSGRGLFSSGVFQAGDLLFVEASCFDDSSAKDTGIALLEAWQTVDLSKKQRWSQLSDGAELLIESLKSAEEKLASVAAAKPFAQWVSSEGAHVRDLPSIAWLRGTLRINGYARVDLVDNDSGLRHVGHLDADTAGRMSLFAGAGLMNHSCYPTVEKLAFQGWLVTRASRPLRAGLELTHAYIDVRQPVNFRRKMLKDNWGFLCKCHRCLFECEIWANMDSLTEGGMVWQSYHMMMEQGKGGLQSMMMLLQAAAQATDKALESYLVRESLIEGNSDNTSYSKWRSQFTAAFDLTAKQSRALLNGMDPGKAANPAAVAAFKRLRNLSLASLWLAPAMQFAQGLFFSKRWDQLLQLQDAVNDVLEEVMPGSALHVASVVQSAVCITEAGKPDVEVVSALTSAVKVVEQAYGDGVATLRILLEEKLGMQDGCATTIQRILKTLEASQGVKDLGVSDQEDSDDSVEEEANQAQEMDKLRIKKEELEATRVQAERDVADAERQRDALLHKLSGQSPSPPAPSEDAKNFSTLQAGAPALRATVLAPVAVDASPINEAELNLDGMD